MCLLRCCWEHGCGSALNLDVVGAGWSRVCATRTTQVQPSVLFAVCAHPRLSEGQGETFELYRRWHARGGGSKRVRVLGGVHPPAVPPRPSGSPGGHQAAQGRRALEAETRCAHVGIHRCRKNVLQFTRFYSSESGFRVFGLSNQNLGRLLAIRTPLPTCFSAFEYE